MTLPGLPDSRILFAWHRRFPDRLHLWAGQIRLWLVELPLRASAAERPLAEWIANAAAVGLDQPGDVARKLGLPEAAMRDSHRPVRRAFTFLELPGGASLVQNLPRETWKIPMSIAAADLPRDVLCPPGVDVHPLTNDWRTIPFVRAAMIVVAAVRREDGIEVYAADADWTLGSEPTWRLGAGAIVPEAQKDNGTKMSPGEQWMWSGDGLLREALLIEGTESSLRPQ